MTQEFLCAGMTGIPPVCALRLHLGRKALRQEDQVGHAEDADTRSLDSAIEFLEPVRLGIDPGTFLGSLREDRGVEPLPVDGKLRGVEDHEDLRVETE